MENNIQKREENLKNAREVVAVFEVRLSIKVRRQEKLDLVEEQNFRRGELLEKYTTKMLYRYNNRNFEEEDLRKLRRNW